MGYYCAWGDVKMSSSEEEGYDFRPPDGREKRRNRIFGTFDETYSGAVSPMSDDTDRQFWAEDELSNSESRQKLITRRKRRHSLSYRNRTAKRSQSCAPKSSSSSSDSIYEETSPKTCKMWKYCRRQSKKVQSANTEKESSTSIEETVSMMNEALFSPECQTASTSSGKKSADLHIENYQANLSYRNNNRKRANDVICEEKRFQKAHNPSNNETFQ